MFPTMTVLSRSGHRINPMEISPAITIEEIAVQLGRIARFSGATQQWHSVLHHSLIAEEITAYEGYDWCTRATMLSHDFHEFTTSDVPFPFKGKEMSNLQDRLDDIIYAQLNIPKVTSHAIKNLDMLAMKAEGAFLGPRGFVEQFFGDDEVDPAHYAIVKDVMERTGDTINGPDSHGVRRFIGRCNMVFDNARTQVGWLKKSPDNPLSVV